MPKTKLDGAEEQTINNFDHSITYKPIRKKYCMATKVYANRGTYAKWENI